MCLEEVCSRVDWTRFLVDAGLPKYVSEDLAGGYAQVAVVDPDEVVVDGDQELDSTNLSKNSRFFRTP